MGGGIGSHVGGKGCRRPVEASEPARIEWPFEVGEVDDLHSFWVSLEPHQGLFLLIDSLSQDAADV